MLVRTRRGIGRLGAVNGQLETVSCDAITGWLRDDANPNTALTAMIYADGNLMVTPSADRIRISPAVYGTSDPLHGDHGFSVEAASLPAFLRNGQPHTISLRYQMANGMPMSIDRPLSCGGVPMLSAPPISYPAAATPAAVAAVPAAAGTSLASIFQQHEFLFLGVAAVGAFFFMRNR